MRIIATYLLSITLFLFHALPINAQTLPGDANGDGRIDGVDYSIWLTNYGRTNATGPAQGDFNSDFRVDGVDYAIWLTNYGNSSPVTPTATPTLPPAAETITVDYALSKGPVTHRATGFIGSLTDTQPPDALILPLKPRLFSWVTNWSAINRAMQNGITYQRKIRNMSLIPSDPINGDWSKWESAVRTIAGEAKSRNYTNVEFDIWNEPEFGDYWTGPIDERYFQMWIRAYRTIKSVDPGFLVAGPSSTNYGWTKGTFLTRAMAERTVPDVLTYHELWSSGNGVAARVEEMRAYLASKGYPNWKISINEYNSSGDASNPGILMRFIYEFELAKVHSAAKACWQEGGDWNCPIHLDNTLTYPDQKPRSVWWVYRSYADFSGEMVGTVPTVNSVAIAAKDNNLKKGYIMTGNFGGAVAPDVKLVNLNYAPFYTSGRPIKVTIKRIPNSGTNALSAPLVIQDYETTPVGTTLTIRLPSIQQYDVYSITLGQ